MDVVAAVGADEESAAVVQPGEGSLDDPAVAAEAGAVLGLPPRDQRLDAPLPDETTVLVVVVARLDSADAVADYDACGGGTDQVMSDSADRVEADCETVS